MMRIYALLTLCWLTWAKTATAQYESIVQSGEIGVTLGAASYFGDLNTRADLSHSKVAFGAFFRKQFGDYIALRVGGQYALVGYSDSYSKNTVQKSRNLSFNSNIWELTLQGDFNFFKFNPIDPYYRWTPYLTFGIGVFAFDPYAYLDNQKYYLRPLGTEGQGSTAFPSRKQYNTMAVCFPLGMGIKYAINEKINLGFEVVYRFTGTDYLDDVSTTYAGLSTFPTLPDGSLSTAALLQDRSYEYGDRVGTKGRQRGYSGQKDSYMTGQFTVSFNLTTYRCPPVPK